jgi:hypothetical protein
VMRFASTHWRLERAPEAADCWDLVPRYDTIEKVSDVREPVESSYREWSTSGA